MKKILILMTIIFLSYFSKAQGITTQGAANSSIISRGGLLADSMFVVPLRDTIPPPTYNNTLRKTGAIVIKSSNQLPYYFNGTKWVQFSIGTSNGYVLYSDSNTVYVTQYGADTARSTINTQIGLRVKYSDSVTTYVTPTMLNDTAAAIRAAIPAIPTLYYQTVQRNAVSVTQRPRLNFSTQFSATDNGGNTSSDIAVTSIAQNIVTGLQDSLNTRVRYTDTSSILGNYAYKDGSNATGTWNNNANTATKWITPRTVAITGDLTYNSGNLDGSTSVTAAGTLATVNANTGTFGSATQAPIFTVNGKGLITAASNTTITPAIGSITGLGTGVATALGVNVGTAGAFVVNGGALGTPSSGNGSNLTNITATTNANLTGPITSVGNTTSVASQTGTGSTFAMSVGPSFTGTANAVNMNVGGGTSNAVVTATSATDISLTSTGHGLTVGGAASSTNMALGEYATGVGIQARNNGNVGVLHLNAEGGDVRAGFNAPAGASNLTLFQTGTGTGDYAEISARNGAGAAADGLLHRTFGTAWTTSGSNFQDGAASMTGTNLSGGYSIGTQASADLRFYTNNTLRTTWAAATGNITTTGGIASSSVSAGIGYAVGAGLVVTQITSKATGVTINAVTGAITTNNAALAAGAEVKFTVTNSCVAAIDIPIVAIKSGGTSGRYLITVSAVAAGSFDIVLSNVSAGSLSEAVVINFGIIKGQVN